jgi:hypothetical protein
LIDDTDSQPNLEIVVYHEVGHAVVAELLGKPIKYIQIIYTKRDGIWNGNTPLLDDLSSDINFLWPILYLVPNDDYKDVRDRCIIKFAGFVTEKQMGIDEKIVLKGCFGDFEQANFLITENFSSEEWEEERRNAEIQAGNVLSNPIYWSRVQNISKELISAIVQGRPQRSNDYRDVYEFSRNEIRWPTLSGSPKFLGPV